MNVPPLDAKMNVSELSVFCITLDQSKPRFQSTMASLKNFGFDNINVLPGVNGKEMTYKEIKPLLDYRSWNEFINGRYVHEGLSSKGSIGCYLSHVNAWKKCVELNQNIIVCEDDCVMEKSMSDLQKAYNDAVNLNFDILLCHHMTLSGVNSKRTDITTNICQIDKTISLMFYIITPGGAKLLLEHVFPIQVHIDHYVNLFALYYPSFKKYYTIENFPREYGNSVIGHNSLMYYQDGHCVINNGYPTIYLVVLILLVILLLIAYNLVPCDIF